MKRITNIRHVESFMNRNNYMSKAANELKSLAFIDQFIWSLSLIHLAVVEYIDIYVRVYIPVLNNSN